MNMDLSLYSKDNKKVLKQEEKNSSKKSKQIIAAKKEVEQQVGRPSFEDPLERLVSKVTVNLKVAEKEFLDKLQKDTGIPVSTYLRRKLLEAKAFD